MLMRGNRCKWEFVYGFDARGLDVKALEEKKLYSKNGNIRERGELLTPGEIACALSHRKVYETMLDRRLESALILEDDVKVKKEHLEPLKVSLEHLPPNWELAYLGYAHDFMVMPLLLRAKCLLAYPLLNALGVRSYNTQRIRKVYRRPHNRYWDRAGCFNGAFAYALTRCGAEKLLQRQTPVTVQADTAIQRLVVQGRLRAYSMVHDVFEARLDLPSTIGDRPTWRR